MPAFTNILTQQDPISVGLIPEDAHAVAAAWFPNRHPLTLRFHHGPLGSESWKFANEQFRPRQVGLTTDVNGSATTLVVTDASIIEPDDVLKLDNEFVLVTASAGTAPGNLTVVRAYAGTTGASHTAGSDPNYLPVYLVTNTRTGYAENIAAMSRLHSAFTNYVQTCESSYAVGGRVQALDNYMGGDITPLGRERTACMMRVLDNFESGLYIGRKVGTTTATTRTATAGLQQILVTNNFYQPTNYTAYTPGDMIRDAAQRIFDAGGNPTHVLVSTDFLSGFYKWGVSTVSTNVQETVLGTKVNSFAIPFLNQIEGIPAPLLPRGTMVMLSEPEVTIRMTRELQEIVRGRDGDVQRGDFLMEGGLEVANEAHHAWISGITGFGTP